jgi:hypothetical protein
VTIFEDLYKQFVEPYLRDERVYWDNLSHGKTYTKPIEGEDREKEAARQRMEAERKAEEVRQGVLMPDEEEEDGTSIEEAKEILKTVENGGDTEETSGTKQSTEDTEQRLGRKMKLVKRGGDDSLELTRTEKEAHQSFENCREVCKETLIVFSLFM